jgi:tRNA A-37 threonylcarbamoyl transferase component Bud32
MPGSGEPIDARALLEREEMSGERLANRVRLGYAVVGSAAIASVASGQTVAATVVWSTLTGAFVAWGLVVVWLLRDPGRYRPFLKYLSVTIDTTLFHVLLVGSLLNHSGYYEVFRSPTMWLWIAINNGITGVRYSWKASALAGCLTVAYGALLILYAHVVLRVPWVAEARYLGEGLFIGDCALNVVGCALPAFFAAVLAGRAKLLVDRVVEEATLRREQSGVLDGMRHELRRQLEQRSRRLLEVVLPRPRGKALAEGAPLGDAYQVVRLLGSGGMGVVYEVERTTDRRRFAAKVLTRDPDRAALARFAREGQILARLDHPNLITIHDIDIAADGALYIVMELVEGSSLRQLQAGLADRDLAWRLDVLGQIAIALDALHRQGVVHRDLKPENVLVAGPGASPKVKLADFGIAILVEDNDAAPALTAATITKPLPQWEQARGELVTATARVEVTRTGAVVGTPLYMAPELAHGSRDAKPSVDVYSFGVIAFELITGRPPFARPAIVGHALGEKVVVPALAGLRPDLDPTLAELFERCLAVEPEDRPSARELKLVGS